jgi:hypothetical protein
MTTLVLAIPNEQGMRALTGIQYGKEIAFPTGHGKFVKVPVTFVYQTRAKSDLPRANREGDRSSRSAAIRRNTVSGLQLLRGRTDVSV